MQPTIRWNMGGATSRSLIVACGLAAALLIPSPCSAQYYIGLYGGATIPSDADLTTTDLFRQDLEFEAGLESTTLTGLNILPSSGEFDAGALVGARIGYWLEQLNSPFIGLEAEVYGAFPSLSDQTLTMQISGAANGTPGATSASIPIDEADLNLVTVGFNALVRYPFGPIPPYGGAGLGIATAFLRSVKVREPTTITLAGTPFTYEAGDTLFRDDKDTAVALQLIGGVRGFLNDNVALFAEYKYVKADLEFQSLELDYEANQIYGGIEYYFGPGVKKSPFAPPPPQWP